MESPKSSKTFENQNKKFFSFYLKNNKIKSMVKGLSHIVFIASSEELFQNTLVFYKAFGFKLVNAPSQAKKQEGEEKETWLKLSADAHAMTTDIIVRLVLNARSTPRPKPSSDQDWGLNESALALSIVDVDAVKAQLDTLGRPYQDRSIKSFSGTFELIELYTLDPLNNTVIFANKPAFPSLFESPLLDSAFTEKVEEQVTDKMGRPKRIGVLTSGGDAPGMNAAVRGVVRYGISKGCEVYAVYEGYQGLVDNGIKKMDWKDARGFLAVGGTNIGTARCMAFKERKGRLKAAENLIKSGIDALIVCGGDGSLTGADVFRSEWNGLTEELLKDGRITEEEAKTYNHLTIVGLVGSIDNDMSSTDITIGAVTSLHRICEAVDSIGTTALSHSRAFVIEVMGRHCGWLALAAGIATGADFVFIPERPPSEENWQDTLCAVAQRHRQLGKRKTVVIVAEGAIDMNLNPIRPDDIKAILADRLGLDTRVTTLGHTQRGGSPCSFDRILATIQSVAAVDAVLSSTPETPSPLIGMSSNQVTCQPLMKAVELTHEVAKAISEKNFARAMELRDPQFADEFVAYTATTILDDQSMLVPKHRRLRVGIIHVGAPAGGMNAATRTAVRYALNRGHTPFAILNGFPGLASGSVEELSWIGVDGWTPKGGSELGTNRAVPGEGVDMGMVAYQLQKFQIQSLLIIGGFEAFSSAINLEAARKQYPSLNIPIALIPATVSNNVPGTDFSLGSDTALNAIVNSCDAIVQSARSSRRRVFVIEVQGGRSGYLAVEAGLASGANTIYIPEEGVNLARLQSDSRHLMAMYMDDDADKSEGRIILRNETVSKTYTTNVISDILKEEGHALFDSRTAVLGHIQQGVNPSPMDRIRATRLSKCAIDFFEDHTSAALEEAYCSKQDVPIELSRMHESAAVVGLSGVGVTYRPVTELIAVSDMKNRKPLDSWWMEHRPLVDLLSGRGLFTPQAQAILSKKK
ncbi:6-phosphofructokinase [Gilbertella persicaria]|uniref:6-phosphofructokinase n=1 Tax=Gilbertella persicaria TaxID=101096 RepID=UPI00221F75DA|nr:6-phosphofructokinase [Gilbertella persicaria]KAI8092438.1 6-phosphofructokinase [Gilbertella persicaria]